MKTIFTALALSTALILGSVPANAQTTPENCVTQEMNQESAVEHGYELLTIIEADVEAFKDYLVAVGKVAPQYRAQMNFDLVEVYDHEDTAGYVIVLYRDGCVQTMFGEEYWVVDDFIKSADTPATDD